MSKQRKEHKAQRQPATEALERSKLRRPLPLTKIPSSSQTHSGLIQVPLKPSLSQSASEPPTIDMSSILQETNAIEMEAFRFPIIEWSFDQDSNSESDESDVELPSFSRVLNIRDDTMHTNKSCTSAGHQEPISGKRKVRDDAEHPARLVRSRGLYSNLYLLGESFSSLTPAR